MSISKRVKRILTLCLTMVLVLSAVLGDAAIYRAEAASTPNRVADTATHNGWKDYFPVTGTLSTKEAGAVWTDKSVFEPGNIPAEWTDVTIADTEDNFLVAMSALAANKIVKGYSHLPTDTMLILDVSGSMDKNRNDCADDMVKAANDAITRLLALNKNNRVGVVLYSGSLWEGNSTTSTATVLLGLERYNAGAGGKFLTYSDSGTEKISVASGVKIEGATTSITNREKNVQGATYIQNGIWKAAEELMDPDHGTVVTTGVQAGTARMPIMVLMSDGAPTAATTSYMDPGTSNVGNGTGNGTDLSGFLTQLTAAYAKAKVEEHYGRDSRFYTLGLSVKGNSIAEAVLNPADETTQGISNYWSRYLAAGNNASVNLGNNRYVTKSSYVTSDVRYYADAYYEAVASQGVTVGDALISAFGNIIDEIILQSRYYPTLVDEGNPDVDGYVTFRDEIGMYMEVTDIKGIRINGVLHTGALLARNFVDGGGDLGTLAGATALGDEFVWAVQKRLGISDVNEVRALINAAYEKGQLSYTSDTEFSNYIGWFGDGNEQFVDFWYEGMPEAQYPANAVFINKSYGFLGDVDTAHGIAASDMMYTMVRVRERIKEANGQKVGEVIVDWSIPAALVPTITYEVELNGDNYDSGIKAMTVEQWKDAGGNAVAYAPMRLMYEVALRSDINELNIVEKTGGQTTFYTNAYNANVSDTSVNTFSHFEPSKVNERFYFIENKDILVKNGSNYVPYTGTSAPVWAENTYYHAHVHFEPGAGVNGVVTEYEPLTEITFSEKKQDTSDNTWYIPSGVIHRYYHNVIIEKSAADNKTGTLGYSLYPQIKYESSSSGSQGHYYVTSTLGNNGKLTVTPATGILLTKELAAETAATTRTFTFEITGGSESKYTVTPLNADGTFAPSYDINVNAGKATVSLKPGETVYITGMSGGVEYTITEQNDSEYAVEAVTVNGAAAINPAKVTPAVQTIVPVVFTNAEKGEGGLYITKEVNSATSFPNQEFELTVNLTGNENSAFEITATDMSNVSGAPVAVTGYTYANDTITGLKIVHGQTIYISGLTEGTVATVVESTPNGGFTLESYSSIDYSGQASDNDGQVTIYDEKDATVVVKNKYQASAVPVNVKFEGTKRFNAAQMTQAATFTFRLEKWNGTAWAAVDTKDVTFSAGDTETTKPFVFDPLNLSYNEVGTHSYRIVEEKGANTDVTYDVSIYEFDVIVTDNGNGTLKAEVVTYAQSNSGNFNVSGNSSTGWTVETTFVNEYHTAGTYIDLLKKVEDTANTGKTAQGFVFESYKAKVDSNGNVVEDSNGVWTIDALIRDIETDALGEARFVRSYDNTDFTTNDSDNDNRVTYYFIIAEKNQNATGWIYDNTTYQVTVNLTREAVDRAITARFTIEKVVRDDQGAIVSVTDVTADTTTGSSALLEFSNVFDPDDVRFTDVNTIPVVTKKLTGRELNDSDKFKFEIVDSSNTVVSVGYNNKEGLVSFAPVLTFNEVGTYHYEIREEKGSQSGITYDTTVYDMVVTVTEKNGVLKLDYYFEDATTKTVTFTNNYKAAPDSIVLEGTKTLSGGRNLLSGEFTFDLVEMTDSTFQTAKTGGVVLSTSNTGASSYNGNAVGSISFAEITYDTAGTYYYKVTERAGGLSSLGVTYSTDAAYITVTVTDDNAGKLNASASYTMANADGTVMNFVNTYKALPGSADFSVSKELEGRTLDNGEFTFALHRATVSPSGEWTASDPAIETVSNTADGAINFAAITYDTAGTYYYIVKEIAGNKGGVVYDDTEFRVTVTVTDNWRGRLEVETSIVDQEGTPYDVIVFNNTYSASDSSLVLESSKVLNGRNMKAGEVFTFVVTENGEEVSRASVTGAINGTPAKILFQPIRYTMDDIGTHTYVISENSGVGDITYDTTTYTVVVEVSDNRDGTLKMTVTGAQSTADNTYVFGTNGIGFTNTYTPDDVYLNLSGTKYLTGDAADGLSLNEYGFVLKRGTGTSAVVIASTGNAEDLNAADNGTEGYAGAFAFPTIELGMADLEGATSKELLFSVEEIVPDVTNPTFDVNMKYDRTVYEVRVTLSYDSASGVLSLSTPVISGGNGLVFTNIQNPDSVSVSPEAFKYTANAPQVSAGDVLPSFSFSVLDTSGNIATTGHVAAVSDGDAVSFGTLTYTAADVGKTYTYTIKESNANASNGVTYDGASYTFNVHVDRDPDTHALRANLTYTDGSSPVFRNTYAAEGFLNIIAKKILNVINGNRTLKAGDFNFKLERLDASDNVVATHTASNDEHGNVNFGSLYFTHADLINNTDKNVIKYRMTEVPGSLTGITYDQAPRDIYVAVEHGGSGVINAYVSDSAGNRLTDTTVTFTNSYKVTTGVDVTLQVKKQLTGRDLEEGEFSFELFYIGKDDSYLSEPALATSASNAADGMVTFVRSYPASNGAGTFKYRIAEVKPTTGALGGVEYSTDSIYAAVTVIDDNSTLRVDNIKYYSDDTFSPAAEIGNGTIPTITNKYEATGTHYTPDVDKELTGRILKAGEFTFEVYEYDVTNDTTGTKVSTGTNHADGSIAFDTITYNDKYGVGEETFTYKIVEVEPSTDKLYNVDYQKEPIYLQVVVKDNAMGSLVVTSAKYYSNAECTSELTDPKFVNRYTPDPVIVDIDADLKINADKIMKIDNPSLDYSLEGFVFNVIDENGTVVTTGTSDRYGNIDFGTLTFTEGGQYYYRISEVDLNADGDTTNDKPGVTFSQAVWELFVNVRYDQNTGILEILDGDAYAYEYTGTTGQAGSIGTLEFKYENSYHVDPVDVTWTMTKKLTHTNASATRTMKDNEFRFQVVDENNGVVAESTNAGSDILFKLTFDKVGTYQYTVKEVLGNAGGISYDDTTYPFTVVVSHDAATGKLIATLDRELNGKEFENFYVLNPAEATIKVRKYLENRELKDREFSFVLTDENNRSYEAVNDRDGLVTFETLTFDAAGIYKYTLTEKVGDQSDIIYSETTYHVTINVEDNQEGDLVASIAYTTKDENGTEVADRNPSFTNIYVKPADDPEDPADPMTSFALYGQKVLKGRAMAADEFKFQVTDSAGNVVATGTNTADGMIQFSPMVVFAPGQYVYTVSEVNTGILNMTYDNTKHIVVVDVERNGDALEATIKYPQGGMTFVNSFGTGNPRTGDETPIVPLCSMMLLSAAGIALLLAERKKRRNSL